MESISRIIKMYWWEVMLLATSIVSLAAIRAPLKKEGIWEHRNDQGPSAVSSDKFSPYKSFWKAWHGATIDLFHNMVIKFNIPLL